jgi:Domain of unknown function (DUF4350)
VKERLTTLVCALGALALFLAMLLHGDDAGNSVGDVPRPTSEEWRPNGYHGAMTWLNQQHFRAVSVRDRFNELTVLTRSAATGNLLIVTLPAATAFKTEEFRPLESWVRAGNTLLVLAALSDNPNWAFAAARPAVSDLSLLTGLQFETIKARGISRSASETGAPIAATPHAFAQPQREVLIPNGPHPLFEGVRTALALSDYPAQPWRLKIPYDGFALSLATQRETGEGVLWMRPLGSGRIIVSALGSLFTNRALGAADNGLLLANMVGNTIGPGGAVLFDDIHQGLGANYDPVKFYSDPRLYATVGIVAALWLSWVLGATRLRLPVTQFRMPREEELVQTTGGFLARVLTNDAAARSLFEHFFRRVREHLPAGGARKNPPWELLESHPGIAAAELRQLRQWYAAAYESRRVPLARLHNLMLRIDRHLTPMARDVAQ